MIIKERKNMSYQVNDKQTYSLSLFVTIEYKNGLIFEFRVNNSNPMVSFIRELVNVQEHLREQHFNRMCSSTADVALSRHSILILLSQATIIF